MWALRTVENQPSAIKLETYPAIAETINIVILIGVRIIINTRAIITDRIVRSAVVFATIENGTELWT